MCVHVDKLNTCVCTHDIPDDLHMYLRLLFYTNLRRELNFLVEPLFGYYPVPALRCA